LLALGSAVNRLLDKLEQAIISHRDFAANVAHELRTPLSILALELEQIEGPMAAQMREDLGSMARLVDQLLAVARIEAVIPEELEAVDLGAIAKRVVARMAPLAIAQGRDIELSVEGTALVRGEPETIAGAIRNLVENAVRAAPAGSAVEVSVGPGRTVTVADHGRGIAQKDLEHIFDRYRQGDRKTAGRAGLGLSIVSRTMERHGGAVTIDTSPNSGCSFTLNFPDIEAAMSQASRSIKAVATGEGVVATVSSNSLATSPR
jgi:two-component system, OmpR family, sensor kinase